MYEVIVTDVVTRSPKDKAAAWTARDYRSAAWTPHEYFDGLRVVLLKERRGNRVLPIWLGAAEANPIANILERTRPVPPVRPSTFDLTARLLEIGKMKIEKVAVTSLRENVFYGSIWIRSGKKVQEIDARPSDAITLALGAGARIFVSPETFEQASAFVLKADQELSLLEEQWKKVLAEGRADAEPQEMEWRPLARSH